MTDAKTLQEILQEVVLLGTERRQLDTSRLPSSIAERLPTAASPERQALDALTYRYFYQRTGTETDTYAGTLPTEILSETKPYIGEALANILASILDLEYSLKNELLKLWIHRVYNRGELIPSEKVLPMLEVCRPLNQHSRRKVTEIIGVRGQTILQHKSYQTYHFTALSETQWTEGPLEGRKLYLIKLRTTDPQKAIELLAQTWPSEGVRERISFLQLLSSNLSEEDLPFLVEMYEEYDNVPVPKTLSRVCKLHLVNMLTRLGHRPTLERIAEFMRPYLASQKAKGLLQKVWSGWSTNLLLPTAQDDHWNGPVVNTLFGLEEKNLNLKLYDHDSHYWMSELLAWVPMQIWADLLHMSPLQSTTYLLQDAAFQTVIGGKKVAIFRQVLLDSALRNTDATLVSDLSKLISGEDVKPLVPHMTQPDFEKYVMSHRLFLDLDLLTSRPISTANGWSAHFSKNIISKLLKICKGKSFNPHQKFGNTIARYFHPEAFSHLLKSSGNFQNKTWFYAWRENIVEPIRASLLIRQKLNAIDDR